MSISYRFAKMNARTIEALQNFKNYFSKKRFNKFTDLMGFQIVKILVVKDEERRLKDLNSIDNEGRYLGFQKANDAMLALTLGPILLGAVLTFISIIALMVWVYESIYYPNNAASPLFFVCLSLGFNLFFLNVGPIIARYILPRREVYFDRKNQTASFTWSVDNAQKNEHGHATFAFSEIEAFYANANHSQGHGVTHAMYVAHKDYGNHAGAFSEIRVKDNPQNPNYCRYTWERVVRFMDLSKPLVDSPEIEPFRHLDPVTRDFDKQNNRPEKYWRLMSYKQMQQIEEKLDNDIYRFNFDGAITNPKRWANEEITKPWEKWPIEESLNQPDTTPYWKRLTKTLLRQIAVGV